MAARITPNCARAAAWRRNRLKLAGATVLAGGLCVAAAGQVLEAELQRIGPPPLAMAQDVSTVVLDRNDKLLRAFTTAEGRWRLPVVQGDVDPRYLRLLFAFEDKRFYQHGGVDVLAIVRAGLQFMSLWPDRLRRFDADDANRAAPGPTP